MSWDVLVGEWKARNALLGSRLVSTAAKRRRPLRCRVQILVEVLVEVFLLHLTKFVFAIAVG